MLSMRVPRSCRGYIQEPLRQRYGYKSRLPKAMLYRRLERVGPAELGIYYDQSYRPVHHDGEADQESGACNEAGVADSVRLADNSSSSVPY